MENGELANSATQKLRGTPDSLVEDAWTALGNKFMGLQKKLENCITERGKTGKNKIKINEKVSSWEYATCESKYILLQIVIDRL